MSKDTPERANDERTSRTSNLKGALPLLAVVLIALVVTILIQDKELKGKVIDAAGTLSLVLLLVKVLAYELRVLL